MLKSLFRRLEKSRRDINIKLDCCLDGLSLSPDHGGPVGGLKENNVS